jgi:hypothetical protein
MTRAEAEAQAAKLAAEHPDRETHRWLPREDPDGNWSVVKVGLPPGDTATTAETRADEKPTTADDPRSSAMQNIGPHAGTGF